jgi:hypothetical protein
MLRSCRPLLRRAVLASGGSALIGCAAYHGTTLAHGASDAALGSLWATACDGMIGVPGCAELSSDDGVLYMAPSSTAPDPMKWPRIFSKGIVFSLTASNPMGEDAPAAWNRQANAALEHEITHLRSQVQPRAWWHSFGFNAQEGWREDGFSLAFAYEERAYARNTMVKLAHKYRQAAIYAYTVEDGYLVREVVWVDLKKQEQHGSKEYMHVLAAPPPTSLAKKDWQPPESPADSPHPPEPSHSPLGRNKSIWSLRW